MAENKQYVTLARENGNVLISEDVIATIVSHAISEVEGVSGLSVKPGNDIVEFLGKKIMGKAIKIVIGEEDELYVDCNVNVVYGQSIVSVAQAAQEAITNALLATAALKVAAVNVNVCGIIRQ